MVPKQAKIDSHGIEAQRLWRCLFGTLVVVALLGLPGCGGCQKKTSESESGAGGADGGSEALAKPAFEQTPIVLQPFDVDTNRALQQNVKPGHWMSARQRIVANDYDFQATFEADYTFSNTETRPAEGVINHLKTQRRLPLAKGQWRDAETLFFIPRMSSPDGPAEIRLRTRVRNRPNGRVLDEQSQLFDVMPEYQSIFLVLADNSDDYGFLRDSAAFSLPYFMLEETQQLRFFDVAIPKLDQQAVIPSQALEWTTIAYLLWDNAPLDPLTRDQKKAIVDWLHFGGQIIVSGPNSWTNLRSSFLNDYLPIVDGTSIQLGPKELAELDREWSIPFAEDATRQRKMTLSSDLSMVGLELKLHPEAEFVEGTGNLVAERRIGNGRIVLTSFPIDHRTIYRWPSFEGFLNGALMRRPARRYIGEYEVERFEFVQAPGREREPLLSNSLRYLSRDLTSRVDGTTENAWFAKTGRQGVDEELLKSEGESYEDPWNSASYRAASQAGVAAWNDFSGVSRGAQAGLEESVGIAPPESRFVIQTLLIYLAALVPLNWLVFRVIKRVEWAWIAAPVIAIVGTIVVVRFVAEDVGFTRTKTEIAVLELHAGHQRGHLSRYAAVYAPLATRFDLSFEDRTSQALPMKLRSKNSKAELTDSILSRDREVVLNDFSVDSAAVRLVHSEQMYDSGGPVVWNVAADGTPTIENRSSLSLRDVGILHRTESGELVGCWVGELSAGANARRVSFQNFDGAVPRFSDWDESDTFSSNRRRAEVILEKYDLNRDQALDRKETESLPSVRDYFTQVDQRLRSSSMLGSSGEDDGRLELIELEDCFRLIRGGEIHLGEIFDQVLGNLRLRPGESRLIAWSDSDLKQLQFKPRIPSRRQKTLVVVHLEIKTQRGWYRDANVPEDITEQSSEDESGE